MLLYKFRSFDTFEHLLDILVHERLYCSEYKQLNDPFEGTFYSLFSPRHRGLFASLTAGTFSKPSNIDNLIIAATKKHVCSLSSQFQDVRLWSLYAGGHSGVALEIDFAGHESDAKPVKYVNKLPEYYMSLLTMPSVVDVLTNKTNHWSFEDEYRVIGEAMYYSVAGRIRRILAGPRSDESRLGILGKVTNGAIPIIQTKLDFKEMTVGT